MPKAKMLGKGGVGITLNIGNYESVRIEASVECDRKLTSLERDEARQLMRQQILLSESVVTDTVQTIIKRLRGGKRIAISASTEHKKGKSY
jgi:hypothetical protein